jgi:septin family protein
MATIEGPDSTLMQSM